MEQLKLPTAPVTVIVQWDGPAFSHRLSSSGEKKLGVSVQQDVWKAGSRSTVGKHVPLIFKSQTSLGYLWLSNTVAFPALPVFLEGQLLEVYLINIKLDRFNET